MLLARRSSDVLEGVIAEVVQKACLEGPQVVTLVLSSADYDALRSGRPTLVDDLLAGPSWDDELAEARMGGSGASISG
ncbi:hypothetical protein ACVME5_006069 [Bradyrhizobium liaoningense]